MTRVPEGILDGITRPGEPEARGTISHYVYFKKKRDADQTAVLYRSRQYHTIERLGGDGEHWLVLVQHVIPLREDAIEDAAKKVRTIARQAGGEYDGWEMTE